MISFDEKRKPRVGPGAASSRCVIVGDHVSYCTIKLISTNGEGTLQGGRSVPQSGSPLAVKVYVPRASALNTPCAPSTGSGTGTEGKASGFEKLTLHSYELSRGIRNC